MVLGAGVLFLGAYFMDSIQLSNGLKIAGVFATCLLLISGIQASIWGDNRFPKREANKTRHSSLDGAELK
jgi:hypothetical protein